MRSLPLHCVCVQAGQTVELFYNPDLTPLRGRPTIQLQGGFNRWGHGEGG